MKPDGARCTSRLARGTVSRVNSETSVKVDGIPRHVADLMRMPLVSETVDADPTDAVGRRFTACERRVIERGENDRADV